MIEYTTVKIGSPVRSTRWRSILVGTAALALSGSLAALDTTTAMADTAGQHIIFSHGYPAGQPAYNYSPTMVRSGDSEEYFWCGYGAAAAQSSQGDRASASDVIYHASYNVVTHVKTAPEPVLRETIGQWDERWTCNPSVIMGSFSPFGDHKKYSIALYYVGSSDEGGQHNSIGVAFSNDWTHFRKWTGPVLSPPATPQSACQHQDTGKTGWFWDYGYGQPSLHNDDGGARLSMFFSDACTARSSYYRATTTNGVDFSVKGTITAKGLLHNEQPANAALTFDPAHNVWYLAAEPQTVPRAYPSNGKTGHERARWSFGLYEIPGDALMTGSSSWRLLTTVDTNLTGYETNSIPTVAKDLNGNLVPDNGNIVLDFAASPRPPASSSMAADGQLSVPQYWKIAQITWRQGHPLLPFRRYLAPSLDLDETTTGYVDPAFTYKTTLGSLYETPTGTATRALYGCRRGPDDYFVSLDPGCENQKVLGLDGYADPANTTGKLLPLYRCFTGTFHFVTEDTRCEGHGGGNKPILLGYSQPS